MNAQAFVAAVVLSLTAAVPPVFAQSAIQTGIVESRQAVPYGDLRLASEQGRRTFAARLDRAIDDVCGPQSRVMQVEARRAACRRNAHMNVEAQVREAGRDIAYVGADLARTPAPRF